MATAAKATDLMEQSAGPVDPIGVPRKGTDLSLEHRRKEALTKLSASLQSFQHPLRSKGAIHLLDFRTDLPAGVLLKECDGDRPRVAAEDNAQWGSRPLNLELGEIQVAILGESHNNFRQR